MGCVLFNIFINDLEKLLNKKPKSFTIVKTKADDKKNEKKKNILVCKMTVLQNGREISVLLTTKLQKREQKTNLIAYIQQLLQK